MNKPSSRVLEHKSQTYSSEKSDSFITIKKDQLYIDETCMSCHSKKDANKFAHASFIAA